MALNKSGLASALKSIFDDKSKSSEYQANAIANAIDTYVKTGQVNSGIAVQVSTGTGTGATTGLGTIS